MKMHMPIRSTVEKAAQIAMREIGRAILNEAKTLMPEDTGDSKKSGFVSIDDLTLQVGFRSLVAKIQHERTDYEHTDGGQAKFLETAIDQALPNIETVLAARVRRALGG